MPKITFVGAGSLGFTRGLVRDLLTFPALSGSTIALMDIDEERLEYAKRACERIVREGGYPAKVEATTDRRAALEGADAVCITILAAPPSVWRTDIEIPKQFGVDINVGDTRGPAGVFRFLRTAPAMMDICRTMEEVCPNAILLNYTNPMAMLCRLMQSETKITSTGLCHSVQGTAEMLARWIGADMADVTYLCAGINHQAFYVDYRVKGVDAYPQIFAAMERPEVYNEEQVRNEMFLHLGYYVTESSGHNSEYNAWFRKRPDLIEKYCTNGTGWNPGEYAYILKEYLRREDDWKTDFLKWLENPEPVNLKRGHEYAASIINAIHGDGEPFLFNGNVRNFGLIDNLPTGCCVEVPVYADRRGLNAVHVGPLPRQLQALVNNSANCEEMAVEAAITGDPSLVFHSILFDPLTQAVCSMAETKAMVKAMFEANKDHLPQFKHFDI
ncbi:MAG: alpha-galactosidase [Armatimonadetes bacterium]|nr:alpha-galactosidase [Armatimonadota bacterium]